MHMNFIMPYRPVYLLKIKTANGTTTAVMFYTCGSCLLVPFVTVYKDLTHSTFR